MVIAATDRLARTRRQEYDWKQEAKGLRTWPTAPVKTLNMWITELWEEAMYGDLQQRLPRPLRSAEEQVIWEEILRSDTRHRPLDIASTAELARTSWKLLCDWRLPLDGPEWNTSEDARAFREWALKFQTRCDRNGYVSVHELFKHVAELIHGGHLTVPDEIELAGFLDMSPSQKLFLETLQEHGTRIREALPPERMKKIVRLQAVDPHMEIRAAAEWARRILENDPASAEPSFRIGIVVPGIRRLRSHFERVFSEVFHPRSWLRPDRDPKRLFHISLGIPASEYPVIQSALQILSLDMHNMPIEEVSRLILSPFLPGFDGERTARALLDIKLRERGEQYIALSSVSYLAKKKNAPFYSPALGSLLDAWQVQYADMKGQQRPGLWAESFSRLLQSGRQTMDDTGTLASTGWPGYWPPGSIEYQTCAVWEELLSGLVELDGVCKKISRQRAVSILRRMASSKIFQPESEPAPVQIMGIPEAAGLSFDHLWMLGMHDDAWPPPCEPAPFVPIRLQRKKGLWRSTPEGMLEHARMLADQLLKSAPNVIVSHPEREGDADRRISPLFAHLPAISPEELGMTTHQGLGERIQRSSSLELLEDHQGPPFDDGRAGGGTEIFKLQAACPFRAFAQVRLGAASPSLPEPGLGAKHRGLLVHRILDKIWTRLETLSALQSMSAEEETHLVQSMVQEELDREMPYRHALRNERFQHAEQSRLERMIGEWLALERKRHPFTVLGQEERQRVTIGGIDIDIREDRVDVLEDGKTVILDYKTGECKPADWEGERPDDPQLPIYAAVTDRPIAGIFFGRLKAGKVGFAGVADREGLIPGIKPHREPLPEVVGRWRKVLHQLGQEFKSGCATVDPKDPVQTCKFCSLSTLCRVGSQAMNPHAPE